MTFQWKEQSFQLLGKLKKEKNKRSETSDHSTAPHREDSSVSDHLEELKRRKRKIVIHHNIVNVPLSMLN